MREDLRKKLEGLAAEAKKEQELSRALADAERRIAGLTSAIRLNREKAAALRRKIEEENSRLRRPSVPLSEADAALRRARSAMAQETELQGNLAQIYRSLAALVERRVCPTCDQPVDGEEFRLRLRTAKQELDSSAAKRSALEKEVTKLEEEARASMVYERAVASLADQEDRVYDTEQQVLTDGEELGGLETQRPQLEAGIATATEAAKGYERANEEFRSNEAEIATLEHKVDQVKEAKVSAQVEKASIEAQIADRKARMAELESCRERGDRLREYVAWLGEYFVPALARMELIILTSTNREFDEEFGRWFSFLVEDSTKGVRVDEDFTPSVTQDSYEQEVANLSGGERTALALAYRLALNKTVQRRAGVDAGLLILDEPTDGFSKDQIGKIGDLLKELDLAQAIIVSHERELEGAVDHIFRVLKEDGKSRVQPIDA